MNEPIQDRSLRTPAGEIAVRIIEPADSLVSSANTVVCLHGWLDNLESFAKLAPLLSHHRLVLIDFPGHGHSGHKGYRGFYALWDYVIAAIAVVDELGLESFSVIGHSLGGIVSGLWSISDSRIERMIWLDVVGGLAKPIEDTPQTWKQAIQRWQRQKNRHQGYSEFDKAVVARANSDIPVTKESAEILCRRGMVQTEQGNWLWRSDKSLTLPTPFRMPEDAIQACLKDIRIPLLILLGQQGWAKKLPTLSQRLGCLTTAKVEYLEGGHHLHLDGPVEPVAEHIKFFLDTV